MDINSSLGATAYANGQNARPPVNLSPVSSQEKETSRTDLSTENTAAPQNAFEVNITPEAQARLAAATSQVMTEAQSTAPENQNNQNITPAQESNRIVNIIA